MKRAFVGTLSIGAFLLMSSNLCAAPRFIQPESANTEFTGLVTCSRCLDLAQHKGFTPWSWAMYQVSRGDDIVIKTPSGSVFRLQGDRRQLSKFVGDKANVSGTLIGTNEVVDVHDLTMTRGSGFSTIDVHTISRPPKKVRHD